MPCRQLPPELAGKIVYAAHHMMPGLQLTPKYVDERLPDVQEFLSQGSGWLFTAEAEARGHKKLISIHIEDPEMLKQVEPFLQMVNDMVQRLKTEFR